MDKNTVYILQKDLPNVNAGAKIKLSKSGVMYVCKDKNGYDASFARKLIENNPEWFKPKEEPQWEILEIESYGGEIRKLIDGEYRLYTDGVGFTATYLLQRSDSKIKTVKRLSDGEVFSVGDSLDWMGKIESIEIDNRFDGGIAFINNSQKSCISTAKKAPKEEQAIKPPLGLIPMQIWNEHRLQDINEALERYKDANKDVPETWLTEKESLIRLLYPLKQEQVFTGPESLSQHPMCKKGEEQVPIKVEIMEFGYGKPQENKGKFYVANFNLPNNAKLPTEKYQSIKSAIEDVLNEDKIKHEKLLSKIESKVRLANMINTQVNYLKETLDYINSLK